MNIASGWRSWLCSKIDFDDGVCKWKLMLWNGQQEAHATNLILKTPAFYRIPEQHILFLRYHFSTITVFRFNFDVKFNFSRIGVSAALFLGWSLSLRDRLFLLVLYYWSKYYLWWMCNFSTFNSIKIWNPATEVRRYHREIYHIYIKPTYLT
jgi:hypothetical protein